MLPIVIKSRFGRVGLAGEGESQARRLAMLQAAGVDPVEIAPDVSLDGVSVLFVAGLGLAAAADLAGRARAQGILVNVEDVPELCDFNMPAIVRRGDLLLTASTAGKAPGLARRLREWLQERFGTEWEARLNELGRLRDSMRAAGVSASEIADRTRRTIDEKGWLA